MGGAMNLPASAAAAAKTRQPLAISVARGVPDILDGLAASLDPDHEFLRAAWFRAAGADATLLAKSADGRALAAFPTTAAGPAAVGARAVVGAYWPFRAIPVSPQLNDADLESLLADPRTRAAAPWLEHFRRPTDGETRRSRGCTPRRAAVTPSRPPAGAARS